MKTITKEQLIVIAEEQLVPQQVVTILNLEVRLITNLEPSIEIVLIKNHHKIEMLMKQVKNILHNVDQQLLQQENLQQRKVDQQGKLLINQL